MSKKVTSYQQSGGITAGTVNVGGINPKTNRWSWLERLAWIAGIIAGVATVAGLWWSMSGENKMKKNEPTNKQDGQINISSFNQSGGITAHTVNIGTAQEPWKIGEEKSEKLAALLRDVRRGKIEIDVLFNDPDAGIFGEEIAQKLRALGFDVSGPIYGVMAPFKGLAVEVNQADKPSTGGFLQHALRELGFPVAGQLNPKLQEDVTLLYVGSR